MPLKKIFAAAAVLAGLAACSGGDSPADEAVFEDAAAAAYAQNDNMTAGGVQSAMQAGAQAQGRMAAAQNPQDAAAMQGAQREGQVAQRPGQAPAQASGQLPSGAIRVKRAEIIDRNGFEKPIVASTILAPVDWKTEGGVFWGGGNPGCNNGYNFNFKATSPDGREGYHIFPGEQWQWNSMGVGAGQSGGCPTMQISSVQQYLQNLIGRARPDARIVDYRPRPDITKPLEQLNQRTPMQGGEMRTWVESGEALIAYQENGVDMRETIAAAVIFNYSRMDGMGGMSGYEYTVGSSLPGWAFRAPNGKLDFKVAEMLRQSSRSNPEWSRRIADHNAKIAKTNMDGARKRSQIIAQTGDEIRQMQQDSWERQQESSDRMQRETTEAIRGVETYNDPYNGGTVELDNTYNNAWQLDDGTYVLTDDEFFQPYKDLGIDGKQLEVTQ